MAFSYCLLVSLKQDGTVVDRQTRLCCDCVCRQQGTGASQWDNFVERVKGLAAADGVDVKQLPARVNEVSTMHVGFGLRPLEPHDLLLLVVVSAQGIMESVVASA